MTEYAYLVREREMLLTAGEREPNEQEKEIAHEEAWLKCWQLGEPKPDRL